MTNKACISRLQKEYKQILKDPVPHITAHPSPTSLLEWHFVLEGNVDSDYKGGCYHGRVVFPPQYPFKPPSLSMYTPSGRFAINTALCLSMSNFHPESWNPMWSVGTILTGLLSFLHEDQMTTGSITSTPAEKHELAAHSLAYNMKNPTFRKLFPQWVAEHERRLQAGPDTPAAQQQGSEPPLAEPPQPPQQQQQQQGQGKGKHKPKGASVSPAAAAASTKQTDKEALAEQPGESASQAGLAEGTEQVAVQGSSQIQGTEATPGTLPGA